VVNSGGALAGTGTIAGITTVSSGGALAPGNGGAGTLNLGNLALNSGAILNLELGATGTSDKVAVGGLVSASGTTTINLTALSGFGPGTYPLITGTSAISGANFAIGSSPAGYGCLLTATSGTLSVTAIALPAAPTALTGSAGNGIVALSWNSSATATSYNIKRSVISGTGYVAIASGTATTYSDTGVTNGTTYYYVVSAVNAGGEGANSSEASARPSAPFTSAETQAPPITIGTDGQGNSVVSLAVPASVIGHTYQLQYTSDLVTGTWTAVGSPVAGTGSQITISASVSPGVGRGFFRLLITR